MAFFTEKTPKTQFKYHHRRRFLCNYQLSIPVASTCCVEALAKTKVSTKPETISEDGCCLLINLQVAGSNDVKNPSTGPIILPIPPVKIITTKTPIHTMFHLPDIVGFIPGIRQGHILLPSSGGMGKRLMQAKIALIKYTDMHIHRTIQCGRRYNIPSAIPHRIRLLAGPARELSR